MTLFPPNHRVFVFAAVLGLAVAAAGAAQAFTFEDQGSSGGGQGFTDLNIPKVPATGAQDSRFSSGRSGLTQGNTSFQFGARPSFNDRYNPNSLFDPFARDGR